MDLTPITSDPVARRALHAAGPHVSQISYGTMRLRGTAQEAADHLRLLSDHGITTHHSSHEYDSHALYIEALARCASTGGHRSHFEHIVKLSSPSFDTDRFEPQRIRQMVHDELQSLGADRLTSVQWLFRTPDAQDIETRLRLLADQAHAVHACFDALIQAGDIADVSVFAYHPRFAEPAMRALPTASLCDYLNLAETQNAVFLDDISSFFAIRPLAAGAMATTAEDASKALQWPLLHPTVKTVILSANSPDHVLAAVDAAGQTSPDLARFRAQLAHATNSHQEDPTNGN